MRKDSQKKKMGGPRMLEWTAEPEQMLVKKKKTPWYVCVVSLRQKRVEQYARIVS